MRVLVTRPLDQAEQTAKRLAALGHSALIAPALEVFPTAAAPPEKNVDLVLATSAQAFSGWSPAAALLATPLACVGEKTAAAARAAGFAVCMTAPRAEALAEKLIAGRAPGSALYLAGRTRKAVLEDRLLAAGWRICVVETYEARPVAVWPPEIMAALNGGAIDAVLHYSPRSAAAALSLIGPTVAARLRHFCLSEDIAAICRDWAPGLKIFTAFQADEEALMTLLGPSGLPSGSDLE